MAGKFTVSLGKIIDEFHLETIYMPKDPTEILIDENDVTRPGLQLMAAEWYLLVVKTAQSDTSRHPVR